VGDGVPKERTNIDASIHNTERNSAGR
jgi:hypothetical protein